MVLFSLFYFFFYAGLFVLFGYSKLQGFFPLGKSLGGVTLCKVVVAKQLVGVIKVGIDGQKKLQGIGWQTSCRTGSIAYDGY